MAYFSNGSKSACFEEQCSRCKYGDLPCPISFVQVFYNHDAANKNVATCILGELVRNDGTCSMFEIFKKDFELTED